jgi:hypothetical protein
MPSIDSGTSLRRSRPRAASSNTQSEATEALDHSTTTASLAASAASMDFANAAPPSIGVSHQTSRPACSSAAASCRARAWSVRQ